MQAQVLSPSGAFRGMDAMTRVRVSKRSRAASMAMAAVLMLFLVGDRTAYTAIPGIDPLDVLDLAIKNNVLFVVDTSGSMTGTVGTSQDVGGDDPGSRFYKAKRALREVVKESEGLANFGLATFHANPEERHMRATSSASGGTTSEGPMIYVSQDAAAATWLTYFNGVKGTVNVSGIPSIATHNEWTSAELFASLGFIPGTNAATHNLDKPYRATTCINAPAGGDHIMETHCRYYLRSMLLRNNVRFTWDPNVGSTSRASSGLVGAPTPITCPLPPKGLLGDDVTAFNDGTKKRACFQIVNSVTGQVATYFFTSSAFSFIDRDGSGAGAADPACVQTDINLHVPPCTDNSNVQKIQDQMRLELQIDSLTGQPIDVPFAQFPIPASTPLDRLNPHDTPPTFTNTGIRSAGGTPIGPALRWANNYFRNTVFPARPTALEGKQKNFVIVLTDGDDTCDPGGQAAVVQAARDLYDLGAPSTVNRVETLVIVFASSVNLANQIARGGSGNMRDAFNAVDIEELIQSLKDAIALATAAGTFSAQASITESIYELGPVLAPHVDPMKPQERYTANVPVLVQSTFEMPGFKGHLKAFRNAGGTSVEVWDAGQKLLDRVTTGMSTCPRTVNSVKACTFTELHAGATDATVGTSTATLKRRIYTTSRNNLDAVTATTLINRTANQGARVALWPPDASVAPADSGNSGKLDGPLGLASLTEQELKSRFKACVGTNLPDACNSSTDLTRLQQHRREAREMMLAFLAGAQTIPDSNTNPTRTGGTGPTARQLLYKARPWILSESTLSAPAIVTPPLQSKPSIHVDEYTLFRDGPRQGSSARNGTREGFGLRNPDDAASAGNVNLKPAMTVVYHGANDGLHAFRGAPCPNSSLPCASLPADTGGEELWAFVPFDQLGKVADLMKTPRRADKTYMIVAAVRFADVWVPGPFTSTIDGANVAGDGVWRTLLYVGRGIGGKYITALDVTVPGPLTRHSINSDDAFAPIPVWSRGNPDTSNGKPFGIDGNVYNNPAAGLADYNAYLHMGQTWSVPAIANVNAGENKTPRTGDAGVEFVAYVGSGYGAPCPAGLPCEGTTFYALDALTGDVIASTDVDLATSPPATPIFTPNALVASPAVFSPKQLKAGFIGNPSGEKATRVYIGDVYGRLWKFLPSTANTGFPAILMQDFGVQQTIGNAVALLNLNSDGTTEKPHVFLETGRDNRVAPPPAATPPFKIIGLRDEAADGDVTTAPTVLFALDIPGRFRGTLQPATAFNANGGTDTTQAKGRVFFAGTQFNPVDLNCISSFDSILFALTAGTGAAAYDMGQADPTVGYKTFINAKIAGVEVVNGQLVLDQSIGVGAPPLPPAPPTTLPPSSGGDGDVFLGSALPASMPFRVGSVVCQP